MSDATSFEPLITRDGTVVSRSPWGPEDEIGRLNWMTPESQAALLSRLDGSKTFDLAVDYRIGMPSWAGAGDSGFQIWMTHTPRGSVVDNLTGAGASAHEKYSYCGDALHMYLHCGTHIDTLNHVGYFGCFWNGWSEEEHLGSRCWTKGGAEAYPPIIARGVLLDIAGAQGVECLADQYPVTPADLEAAMRRQGTEVRRGDVVLLRLGRMTRWPDYTGYLARSPGLSVESARYLCEELEAMCVGVDTVGADVVPAPEPDSFLPVHAYMFATAGTPIMEVVWLEELAAERIYEFAFIGMPLKIFGATAAPLRPVAMVLR